MSRSPGRRLQRYHSHLHAVVGQLSALQLSGTVSSRAELEVAIGDRDEGDDAALSCGPYNTGSFYIFGVKFDLCIDTCRSCRRFRFSFDIYANFGVSRV